MSLENSKVKMGVDSSGRMCLKAAFPMPPSDNKLYFNTQTPIKGSKSTFHKRILTKEGRAFKLRVRSALGECWVENNQVGFNLNVPYDLYIDVYFDGVENAGYPKKAKTRYKKVDAQNRIKIATDAIFDAVGVDDCHVFTHVVRKRSDPTDPRIEICLREAWPRTK